MPADHQVGLKCPVSPEEFRFFFGPELMEEYLDYKSKYFDVQVMLILFVVSMIFWTCRCNIMHPFDDGIYFTLAFASELIAVFLYHVFLYAYTVKTYVGDPNLQCSKISDFILRSPWLGVFLKDSIGVMGTIGMGFGLYGRTVNGQCPENVTLWESQRCNPFANSNSLPLDHVLFLFILPLHLHSVADGMTFQCSIICWCACVVALIGSMLHIGGVHDLFAIPLFFIIPSLLFKNAKISRLMFAHNKKTLAAEMDKRRYILLQQQTEHQLLFEKSEHESEIISMTAKAEIVAMENEKKQMVALIGNVAHDLKTPLQSFRMDLESLSNDPVLSSCKY